MKWVKKFQEDCTNVHDESHSGHPSAITQEIVDAVWNKILKDCRVKISKLSESWNTNCVPGGCQKSYL